MYVNYPVAPECRPRQEVRLTQKQIIKNSFAPYTKDEASPNQLPRQMIRDLLHRFSSKEGYDIYPDAQSLFLALRIVKKSIPENANWPWGKTIVNVTSNSDSRIISVLESLGVSVGENADVEKVTMSYEVGAGKPDARMFEYAARNAPEDAVKVHVGDDIGKDAVAAMKAGNGWRGLLLDREKKYEEWNADQEHSGLVKIERDGHLITVLDSLESLRHWTPQ
jgi:FMN phosphatase YigB (HAD superfamily)